MSAQSNIQPLERQRKSIGLEQQILLAFEQQGKGIHEKITFAQMCDFFEQKLDDDFDKIMAQKIFQSIDKGDNWVTVQELAKECSEEEENLIQKISRIESVIQEKNKAKETFEKQMISKSQSQQVQQLKLSITVKSAENLQRHDNIVSNLYCTLQCENFYDKTKVVNNSINPQWDETFNTYITKMEETLKVTIMNKESFNNDTFEGQVIIPISSLNDFKQHNQKYQLEGSNLVQLGAKINLILQLAQPPNLGIRNQLKEIDQEIHQQRLLAINLEKQLDQLQEPFKAKAYTKQLFKVQPNEANLAIELENKIEISMGKVNWKDITKYISFAYIGMAVFSMFLRPDFPNLMISLASFILFVEFSDQKLWFRYLICGIFLTMLFDFL